MHQAGNGHITGQQYASLWQDQSVQTPGVLTGVVKNAQRGRNERMSAHAEC